MDLNEFFLASNVPSMLSYHTFESAVNNALGNASLPNEPIFAFPSDSASITSTPASASSCSLGTDQSSYTTSSWSQSMDLVSSKTNNLSAMIPTLNISHNIPNLCQSTVQDDYAIGGACPSSNSNSNPTTKNRNSGHSPFPQLGIQSPETRDTNSTPQTTESTNNFLSSMSQNIISVDYHLLLEAAFPRWTKEGLWRETARPLPAQTATRPEYADLRLAYTCVCELDVRIGDDAIRNRIALIRLHTEYTKIHNAQKTSNQVVPRSSKVGRGDATQIIDCILESIHEGWWNLDSKRRSELRARFHDRKKQGKRWSMISSILGPAILFLCSSKLANVV